VRTISSQQVAVLPGWVSSSNVTQAWMPGGAAGNVQTTTAWGGRPSTEVLAGGCGNGVLVVGEDDEGQRRA
jgi:hypothetical protein